MSTSVAFSSDGEEIITRKVETGSSLGGSQDHKTQDELDKFYEIDRCLAFITDNGYHKIALQFPDSLLKDATQVAVTLRERTNQEIFIMADTSYGSCCVDEVAAEHVQADCVIHHGAACLTPTRRLPVLYIFGDMSIDVDDCAASFRKLFSSREDHLLVLYDTTYSHCIDELRKQVCSDFPNCVFSTLSLPSTPTLKVDSTPSDVSVDKHSSHRVQKSKGHCTSCGAIATSCDSDRLQNQCTDDRSVHSDGPQDETKQINEKERNEGGLCEKLDRTSIVSDSGCTQRQHVASDGSKEGEKSDSKVQLETADSAKLKAEQSTSQQPCVGDQLCSKNVRFGRSFTLNCSVDNYKVFYIGEEGQTLTNLMLNYNKCQFYSYNPVSRESRRETLNVNKALGRRYYLVQKAKEARTVGILVGTLGAANYLDSILRLKMIMKEAGKKYYTIAVGKLNVPKMANFLEIDVFVLVACPENSLLDSQEFYKPVVTPFEMEIACIRSREWSGDYTTDFRELLPGASFYVPADGTNETEFEPEYSLISGGLLPGKENSLHNEKDVSSTALVQRSKMEVALQNSAAAEFLNKRTWRGLEQQLGETEVTMAIQGRSGVAAGYSHELGDT